jgi:SAM-dependent methyltransferase
MTNTPPPPLPNPSSNPHTNPWGDRDWSTYYTAVAGKPPRDTLLLALNHFFNAARSTPHAARLTALDLGAGEGRDTRELLRQGFRVLALDPHPNAPQLIAEGVAAADAERLTIVQAGTESLASVLATRPEFAQADIINASFSLPFIHPARFQRAWAAIRASLAPGGCFAAQFFGPEDSWASIPGRTHHTREQVQQLLEGLTIHQFEESKKPGHDAEGNPKHWHVFHVVAQRPNEPRA